MLIKLNGMQDAYQMLIDFYKKTGAYPSIEKIHDVVTKFLTHGNLYAFVQKGVILALLNLYCNNYDSKEAYICNVYTLVEYRKHGFARALMEQAISHTKESGFKSIVLHVSPNNTPAINLYQILGFVFTGRTKDVEGTTTSEMQLNL